MGITKAERERRTEEAIVSTICGNTTPSQRKVSTEWVALASGTHSTEKVQAVAKKYGMKSTEKEIDLSNIASLRPEYKKILKRREKEFKERLKKRK